LLILKTLQIGLAGLITATQINPLMPIDLNNTSAAKIVQERQLTPIERMIVATSSKYGLHAETALQIAKCESGLRQFQDDGKVVRGLVNPKDVGIFQINEAYHLDQANKLGFNIYSPEGNIGYAMWLMKEGGIRHWNSSRSCWQTAEDKQDNTDSLASR
jgi:hypothetical protein